MSRAQNRESGGKGKGQGKKNSLDAECIENTEGVRHDQVDDRLIRNRQLRLSVGRADGLGVRFGRPIAGGGGGGMGNELQASKEGAPRWEDVDEVGRCRGCGDGVSSRLHPRTQRRRAAPC